MKTIFSVRIPPEVIEKSKTFIDSFIHCEEKPTVEFVFRNNNFEISHAVCNLKSVYNRGCVGTSCDACKIKKESGLHPGENFNPLNHI